jgi:hypothetical protein
LAIYATAAARVVITARRCSCGQLVNASAGIVSLTHRPASLPAASVRLLCVGSTLIDTQQQHEKPSCSVVSASARSPTKLMTSRKFIMISCWTLFSSSKRGMMRSLCFRSLRADGFTVVDCPRPRLQDNTLATYHGPWRRGCIIIIVTIFINFIRPNVYYMKYGIKIHKVGYQKGRCSSQLVACDKQWLFQQASDLERLMSVCLRCRLSS